MIQSDEQKLIYDTHHWYARFANYTFPTSFVMMKEEEKQALADGIKSGAIVDNVLKRLQEPMHLFPGNCFVFCNSGAPTDTERFLKKRGAVYSAKSAWRYLAESQKIKQLTKTGTVEAICIRPFRRMNKSREFRLFVYDKELRAMSQYWLTQHFSKIEKAKDFYWDKASNFIQEIGWLLPTKNIVLDIYFTSEHKILLLDFNPWEKCSPLLLKDWNHDWTTSHGLQLIQPPMTISGDVSVSF